MPADAFSKAQDDAKDAAAKALSHAETRFADIVSNAEKSFHDTVKRAESLFGDGLDTFRAQSRTYADNAGERLDEAQRYVVERVKEKPLTATVAGIGVGLLLGLLLASRNK